MPNETVTDALDVDLLVIGGGMAGMTAASRAASEGCRVLVVEKNGEIGGSAVLSGGKLWTCKTFEHMDEETPGGDPALKRVAFEGFGRAVAWLRQSGVQVDAATPHLHYGVGHNFDVHGYIAWCAAAVTHVGGFIIRGAAVDNLIVEGGRVVGAVVRDRDGETRVRAPHTLLASGGFGAAPALLECFVGLRGSEALARCNPANTGDGLRLGLGAGAALSPSMKGFYGHVMQSPVDRWGPREFRVYTQGNGSVMGLLLNRQGRRFCDESLQDHRNAQRILEQPGARALIVFDQVVRAKIAGTVLANTDAPTDAVQNAIQAGARVTSADRWEDLFEAAAAWGYDAAACLETVADYNERASSGGEGLDPPKARGLRPYLEPPFFAMEGQPGVTATHGGLRIDAAGRVLDAFGAPVPGLHAAGADAGNMHGEGYAGGLNFAAVFGLLAADQAVATLRGQARK